MNPGDKVCPGKGYDCQRVGKTLEALIVKLGNKGIHSKTTMSGFLKMLHGDDLDAETATGGTLSQDKAAGSTPAESTVSNPSALASDNKPSAEEKTPEDFARICAANMVYALHKSGHSFPQWDTQDIAAITTQFFSECASHARKEAFKEVIRKLVFENRYNTVGSLERFLASELAKGTV